MPTWRRCVNGSHRWRTTALEIVERRLYESQFGARRLVEELAVALQGSLLVRHAPPAVADAFCAARCDGGGGRVYGTLPAGVDAAAIVDRALPA